MVIILINRLITSLLMLFILSIITFTVLYLIGDPVDILAEPRATQEDLLVLRQTLGLEGGLCMQYIHFLANFFSCEGTRSFVYDEIPLTLILEKLPATFEVIFPAFSLSLLLGIPLGLFISNPPSSFVKYILKGVILIGFSIPTYITGLIFVWVLSIYHPLFPSFGRGEIISIFGIKTSLFTKNGLWHLALPLLTLVLYKTCLIARTVSTSTHRILESPPVRFAHARGLTWFRITLSFALRGTLGTLVTLSVLEFGGLLAYSVMVEMVFAWPGVGKLLIDSILALDRPVVITYVLFIAVFYLFLNTVAELLQAHLDPRRIEPTNHA